MNYNRKSNTEGVSVLGMTVEIVLNIQAVR